MMSKSFSDEERRRIFLSDRNLLEREQLREAMIVCKYNQTRAAWMLGISRSTIRTKLRKHFGNKYFRDTEV